jgi:mono/diheme cytochrome c family protein
LESTIAVGVPLLLVVALLGLPFFDRRSRRSLRHRPLALSALVFLLGGCGLLLGAAVRDVQPSIAPETGKPLNSAERAGRAQFQRQCASCHVVGKEKGGDKGPDLTDIGAHHSTSWLHSFIEDPTRFHRESEMSPFGPPVLTHEDIEEVARYLSTLRGAPGHEIPVEVHDTFPDLQKSGVSGGGSTKADTGSKAAAAHPAKKK